MNIESTGNFLILHLGFELWNQEKAKQAINSDVLWKIELNFLHENLPISTNQKLNEKNLSSSEDLGRWLSIVIIALEN